VLLGSTWRFITLSDINEPCSSLSHIDPFLSLLGPFLRGGIRVNPWIEGSMFLLIFTLGHGLVLLHFFFYLGRSSKKARILYVAIP